MNQAIELYKLWHKLEHSYTGPYVIHPIEDKDMEVPDGAITVREFLESQSEDERDEFLNWASSENLD